MYSKTDCGTMKACQLSSVWKILEKEFFHSLSTLILHWVKFDNFVMQLKRQSVEAWQNEKHYSKGNNTSENPIPRQEIFKPVDHVKYECQVRSGHNICCLCSYLVELSSRRVTYENCYKSPIFLNLVWGEWTDLRNSNGFELRNFYLTTVWKLFSKIFTRSGKMHHVELNLGTSKSSK